MSINVLMPQLGETVAEGTVAQWHKQVGDRVAADEILLDVETDKVSMEIPAPSAGVVQSILVQSGQTVNVGTVLAVIDTGASEGAGREPQSAAQSGTSPASQAAESAGTTSGAAGASTSGGAATAVSAAGGAERPAHVTRAATATAAAGRASAASGSAAARKMNGQRRLSPAVRRLVAEHQVDVEAIEGTGRSGRITRRDVLQFLAQPAAGDRSAREERPRPAAGALLPFNRIRRVTAEHLVRSKATSAHVLQAVEVDFSVVDQARGPVREAWRAKQGFSLTYLPFIANAVCRALAEFPNLNASIEGEALRLHEHVHLAIAVDLGAEGLVAPVVKDAGRLSVSELALAMNDLATRARQGRLGADDLAGGTYTLTNNGSFGTLITAPIINQPQVAILSTDGVRKKPVVVESPGGDAIAIRPVGILAQSFDHRAVDGAYSGAFLRQVRVLLEQGDWAVEV